MTSIAILGSGAVARALAGPLAANGHSVVIGSRTPRDVRWSDGGPCAATLDEAADGAEVVINALPGAVSVDVLTGLRPALTGSILLDVANAVRLGRDGFATALCYPDSSLAEQLQRVLPQVRVVKTLNTMHDSLMADPVSLSTPLSVFVSGDDADAKDTAGRLLRDLGWPPEWIIDLGGVSTARWPESFVLAVRPLIQAVGPVPFGLAIAR